MQRILVAVDGLPGSEKALKAAVEQAQLKLARVTAVAVVDRSGDPALQRIAEQATARIRRELDDILQACVNYASSRGVPLTPILRQGHPAETIVACAEEEGAELIVLGCHNGGKSPVELGGTADRVSSHAPCTVMIVK
jgi:nucleotide-binding universal stress UspA family protein